MLAPTLRDYLVPGTEEAYYISDFITPNEEQYLIRKIQETPHPKWKSLANRRLQVWGGEMSAKNVLVSQPMPVFLNQYPDILSRIKETGAFAASPHGMPNHVILNEYLPGQGIMPHEDGPAYYPVVATISLGSHSLFHYYRYKPDAARRVIESIPVCSLLLEPRSVVITTGALYTNHLHGIENIEEDRVDPSILIANALLVTGAEAKDMIKHGKPLERAVRYSLTCRDVHRVISATSFLHR